MTYNELCTIRDKKKKSLSIRVNEKSRLGKVEQVLVCGSQGCISCGGHVVLEKLKTKLKGSGIEVVPTGCFGLCEKGTFVLLKPSNVLYVLVNETNVEKLCSSILNNEVCNDLLFVTEDGKVCRTIDEFEFYRHQKFVIMKNLKYTNPFDIEDYIGFDGYFALHKAITQMNSDSVIAEISASGLRGRGGAGFPTGKKWMFAQKEIADQKYVICNGDEGDPGAFMNRSVLEGNPHAVLEGMAIAGFAIGATKGVIYCRAEYALASKRLEWAIKQAREYGLLGKNIFGTNFSFDISVSLGAGAFVCGEETALIASVEGKRGEPRTRPPYPASKGLFGKPTIINNVETLANVAGIILNGAKWFCEIGSEKSKGTKVFALTGKVKRNGLVELPIGTKLRNIVFDIGGGCPNGKKFKAVQIGGPSGGCVSEEHLDIPVDYETLQTVGSMMGSGGMIVVDEDTCMVDFAKFFLQFTVDESCGKCTPCRIGNMRMLEILEKISAGKATMNDLDKLEELAHHIKDTSLCGLGQSSPNPVLSTIKNFRQEYIEHIKNKRCPAHVCKPLISFETNKKCIGCGMCKRACPVQAISGDAKKQHFIDKNICIRCGLCESTCPVGAIGRVDR